jgi:hypothetical protein
MIDESDVAIALAVDARVEAWRATRDKTANTYVIDITL